MYCQVGRGTGGPLSANATTANSSNHNVENDGVRCAPKGALTTIQDPIKHICDNAMEELNANCPQEMIDLIQQPDFWLLDLPE